MAFLYLNDITSSHFKNRHLYYNIVSCFQSIRLRNYASLLLLLKATTTAIPMNDMEKKNYSEEFHGGRYFVPFLRPELDHSIPKTEGLADFF